MRLPLSPKLARLLGWTYQKMLTNGTDYQIDWPNFEPGTSIFIPAVDIESAIKAIQKESERLEFKYVHKVVIENEVQGVRVGRLE